MKELFVYIVSGQAASAVGGQGESMQTTFAHYTLNQLRNEKSNLLFTDIAKQTE